MRDLHYLVDTVQKNCHITDARYARDMTMCTYLLEMRQYYRWEHEVPYSRTLPKDELGAWLNERESLWNDIEASAFDPLPLASDLLDPFDSEAANRALLPQGYVYSAGYGRFHKPHFFLGNLLRMEKRAGFTVLISGCEYARDLVAPPASLQNRTIYLRRESVRRFLWEKFEEWQWRKKNESLSRAFGCYDFTRDADAALESMTDIESEAMILHEVGEGMVGEMLGERWSTMLVSISRRKVEIVARAVRDHLADCLSTLPTLLERGADCSLYFYFANLDGMRKELFPLLQQAYQDWINNGDRDALLRAVGAGRAHWEKVARMLIDTCEKNGENWDAPIEALVNDSNATIRL